MFWSSEFRCTISLPEALFQPYMALACSPMDVELNTTSLHDHFRRYRRRGAAKVFRPSLYELNSDYRSHHWGRRFSQCFLAQPAVDRHRFYRQSLSESSSFTAHRRPFPVFSGQIPASCHRVSPFSVGSLSPPRRRVLSTITAAFAIVVAGIAHWRLPTASFLSYTKWSHNFFLTQPDPRSIFFTQTNIWHAPSPSPLKIEFGGQCGDYQKSIFLCHPV